MKRHRFKDRLLKAITAVMAILFILSASALDSVSPVPAAVCFVSVSWLCLVTVATERQSGKKVNHG